MSRDLYKEHILDHYRSPRNNKRLKEFTHSYESVNRSCGDEVSVQLRIEEDVVKEVGYDVRGCAICTASISMLSEEVKGRRVSEVLDIGEDEVLERVGMERSSGRKKCALIASDAIKGALGV